MTNLAKVLPQQKAGNLHIHLPPTPEHDAFCRNCAGLAASSEATLAEVLLGCAGFEAIRAITDLPVCYPTRSEHQSFSLYKSEIRRALG